MYMYISTSLAHRLTHREQNVDEKDLRTLLDAFYGRLAENDFKILYATNIETDEKLHMLQNLTMDDLDSLI